MGVCISYEKTFQGGHKFYALKNGALFTKVYMFTTRARALADFKRELKGV